MRTLNFAVLSLLVAAPAWSGGVSSGSWPTLIDHRAKILSIEESLSSDIGQLDVHVTYLRPCGDAFQGVSYQQVAPFSWSNPHYEVQVRLRWTGIACHAADAKEDVVIRLPRIAGAYTFIPLQPEEQTDPEAVVWGGEHIALQVTGSTAAFTFDCGVGSSDVWDVSHGKVKAEGTQRIDTGIAIGQPQPVIYSARIRGNTMDLSIIPLGDVAPTQYKLRKGATPKVYPCMLP